MIVCKHDTAVVVLSYNGKDLHQLFFPLLLSESQGHYDVVLVDNACTDDTASVVEQLFPEVSIVRLTVNKGFANGYYEGLKQIQAKYYVLLSADFEVTPQWFQPLYRLMQQHTDIAACQPKIKYYKDKSKFEYAGAGGGFIDKWGYLFCRGRIFFTLEEDHAQYDNTIEVFWASGGCMFVRAEVYHAMGGLDADLYAHMEEVDLCWRMKNAGHRIAYCGSSTVYHIGGSVISYGSPQKLFYNYRNSLILLLKNLATQKLLWMLPFRLCLDGVSGLRCLLKGEFTEVKTIIKAHWSFFLSFNKWYRKRQASKKLIKQQNEFGIYKNSIIVDYFLKKKHLFTDLPFEEKNIL
ncbi:MAG: glycosyltransferase family 2 protein [Bacteroidetes bacterium]|jgi:GT2 family glycosyltransferase|nr:glycosyltransferase family 2 protein [Bacteroidota bacterium]HQW46738.1 glycosyltransferase family 2 protein [Chitinophagaceae bacterium]MBK6818613.1 glycosyltransferase family 2 protein [Bacteroidota bacterium]MBK7040173.1 glycosyltransferase family 2 protein [Bacteroidota bacterium]MBK8330372.1 glycosyltransferase family 2 protein [Bacteroidota bacterium]